MRSEKSSGLHFVELAQLQGGQEAFLAKQSASSTLWGSGLDVRVRAADRSDYRLPTIQTISDEGDCTYPCTVAVKWRPESPTLLPCQCFSQSTKLLRSQPPCLGRFLWDRSFCQRRGDGILQLVLFARCRRLWQL